MENLEDIKSVYRSKRVFLTGHTGFKGSWLLLLLKELGANVFGYSLNPQTSESLYVQIKGETLCDSHIGDIREAEELSKAVLKCNPDFIFHLAAQPLVIESYNKPLETFNTNIIGTANLLEAVRKIEGPCNVVCITTDKVYDNKEWDYPYREIDRLGGFDPYSSSKAAAELLISSYRNSFFNIENYEIHKKAIASARAGNVIGGGDWAENRLVPDIVRSLQSSKPIKLRNPNSVRPWQHVLEPLYGYLLLGAKLGEKPHLFSSSWNFGPFLEDVLTVEEIAKIALENVSDGVIENAKDASERHEAHKLKLDINKSLTELGWRPKWNANKAVEKTMNWYFKKGDLKAYTIQQIKEYLHK